MRADGQEVGNLRFEVDACVQAVETGVLQRAGVVLVTQRHHVAGGFVAAGDRHVVALVERRFEHCLRPVGVGECDPVGNLRSEIGVGVHSVRVCVGRSPRRDHLFGIVHRGGHGILVDDPLVHEAHEGGHVGHEFEAGYGLFLRPKSRDGDGRFGARTFFRSHQNNPVGSSRPVYGGRGGILQHCDALDVVGIDDRHVGHETVDQDQRRGAVDGTDTADDDRDVLAARSAAALRDAHTGD